MESFYAKPEHIAAGRLALTGGEARHCARVLRKKPGDEILVIDGDGAAYRAAIEAIGREEVACAILSRTDGIGEPRRSVTLAVSLLKQSAKFDILVEKCTELGVRRIVPMITERTIARRGTRNVDLRRLRAIALSSTKQSLRSRVPEIGAPLTFARAVEDAAGAPLALIDEKAPPERQLTAFMAERRGAEHVVLLIGPEGGFSDGEREFALGRGATAVSLGPRRLRAETAAMFATGLAALAE